MVAGILSKPVVEPRVATNQRASVSGNVHIVCAPSSNLYEISNSSVNRRSIVPCRALCRPPSARRAALVVRASSGTCHPGEERDDLGLFPSSMSVPTTGMAKFGGQLSGGGATLEKSKLDLSREVKSWEPKLDEGGGGGDIGNKIFNGGGGDGDDGDDDDYFEDFGDGDGDGDGEGFFRTAIGHLYDEASRNAVLQEWFRTMTDLPIMLRQAASFGLLSSAQLVRFFSMDVRPNLTRFVTRTMPVQVWLTTMHYVQHPVYTIFSMQASRGIVGRLMADPAFMQKLAIEQLITLGGSLYWETRARGDRFWKELDLVAINTLSLQAANMALVWMVSPSRSYGVPHKYDWQRMLHELPANVFDASGPQRQYTINARVAGLMAKTAELCAVGTLAGGAMSLLQQGAVAVRRTVDPEFTPSVAVPDLGRAAFGMGASLGLASNARYQLISGADRWLFEHGKYLAPYLASSTLMRLVSNRLGEQTRLFLQGMPTTFAPRAPTEQQQRQQQLLQALQAQARAAARGTSSSKKTKRAKRARGFEMSLGTSS